MDNKIINQILICIIALNVGVLGGIRILNVATAPQKPTVQEEIVLPDNRVSYDYLKSITVYITCTGMADVKLPNGVIQKEPKMYYGTGVVVKEDAIYTYILTNAHVVGKLEGYIVENATVYVRNGAREQVSELIVASQVDDMALIRIVGKIKDKSVIKGIDTAEIQDRVYMVGNNLGTPFLYSEGCLAGFEERFLLFLLPIAQGDSGSAIINEEGRLVGLVSMVRSMSALQLDTNYAVAIEGLVVKQFLQENGITF